MNSGRTQTLARALRAPALAGGLLAVLLAPAAASPWGPAQRLAAPATEPVIALADDGSALVGYVEPPLSLRTAGPGGVFSPPFRLPAGCTLRPAAGRGGAALLWRGCRRHAEVRVRSSLGARWRTARVLEVPQGEILGAEHALHLPGGRWLVVLNRFGSDPSLEPRVVALTLDRGGRLLARDELGSGYVDWEDRFGAPGVAADDRGRVIVAVRAYAPGAVPPTGEEQRPVAVFTRSPEGKFGAPAVIAAPSVLRVLTGQNGRAAVVTTTRRVCERQAPSATARVCRQGLAVRRLLEDGSLTGPVTIRGLPGTGVEGVSGAFLRGDTVALTWHLAGDRGWSGEPLLPRRGIVRLDGTRRRSIALFGRRTDLRTVELTGDRVLQVWSENNSGAIAGRVLDGDGRQRAVGKIRLAGRSAGDRVDWRIITAGRRALLTWDVRSSRNRPMGVYARVGTF